MFGTVLFLLGTVMVLGLLKACRFGATRGADPSSLFILLTVLVRASACLSA